jgi:hypothetical protein
MAERAFISPEEGAELERLKSEYLDATARAMEAIRGPGMDSQAFVDADDEASRAARRIKEILGITGRQQWMA